MSKDPLAQIAARLADRRDALDAEFAPLVRNHLVQLFRAAHAVEPSLTGATMGNGSAAAGGTYTKLYEDGETLETRATSWDAKDNAQPKHAAVREWLAALADYSLRLCSGGRDELPYIDDITPDDLTTERSKRAKVWGKR